jgi:lipopolysaccharide/colanic/teichoic acid biosynthesis glycosyltransferase
MKLIIIHRNDRSVPGSGRELLRFAISSRPIASVILDGLSGSLSWGHSTKLVFAVPQEWSVEPPVNGQRILPYAENVPVCSELLREIKRHLWFVISNGRFATQTNNELLDKTLSDIRSDIVAVNIGPELLAGREKVRLTAQGGVAGIRRLYSDSAQPSPSPADWPHLLFIKTDVLDQFLPDRTLPQSFSDFLDRCRPATLTFRAVSVAGTVYDLETEDGLLNFCRKTVTLLSSRHFCRDNSSCVVRGARCVWRWKTKYAIRNTQYAPRYVGKVLLGNNVEIGPKAIVIGPTIIGDSARIGQAAVINSSIIGPEVRVPQNQLVDSCIVKEPQCNWSRLNDSRHIRPKSNLNQHGDRITFRTWPRFSYPECFKRIADCLAAIIVLILFAPIIPFIALAIKLSSPGPVFFKDKRQGLHGKVFNCLKFRTMLVGADKIQDKLRVVSQVDGPQFKMRDDPRLNTVGRFLRDTYIDEIPQFINVLLGQMSVVGPRPSPESENTLCPSWRDARLSVRPGITGLWQVCRTRRPTQDFQEWIHYDTRYVKNLSLRMDLWICWKTAKKMFEDFIRQF